MIPQIVASAIMGGVICLINFIDMNYILMLAIQVPLGVVVYILCSKFMHIDSYEYLMDTLKSLLNRKKDKKI
jgi:cobalamin synthase